MKRFEKTSDISEKDISDKVRKAKFVFNTRGKITIKESKELQRTHANIFDWIKKGKESIKEKERFEEKENAEENEPMEVEIVEKEERLERVSRRKLTWLTN